MPVPLTPRQPWKADGAIGPVTIQAARTASASKTIIAAVQMRTDFLRNLKTWPTFGKGWQRRVDSVRAVALEMAAAPAETPAADESAEVREMLEWFSRRPENWRAVVDWLGEMR